MKFPNETVEALLYPKSKKNFNPHPRMCLLIFREKGREGEGRRAGERNSNVREQDQWVAPGMHPNQGSNPQPMYVP